MKLHLADEEATTGLGQRLAGALADGAGAVVYLSGPLGAGKTCLSRGLLRGLGYQGAVKSPTYTLVEPYEVAGRRIYHFDLYRLSDPEELEYLGARDYFDGASLCLVEWPERGQGWLPEPDLWIHLRPAADARVAALTAHSPLGREIIAKIGN
ncbi:MAG TPA: tRNA (adenosine(37)-N6)-threonylcarbamoyltransferase complex ATPase subunit type 1 TsaE [Spongiibacteraceae bacterium]|jgi:tRNA threonylcarbamoyladenosine biosynthesis protein TsaE|nr:tRNA (adenosine(37)-N6)-threonylcarbamoyltransferase complex ATPase subunit type 1 TsaE [Spongiibacteraceae bacterium]HUH39211.1 tRNA (adenosine(37)-N6)-threonylcarbamoyltransferase complex ATPase subunit type 1 TsaE [Spongiibacteraceae bacterium]